MGEIRSALDIALEKTAGIQGDKASGDNRILKNAGKKAASEFYGTGDTGILQGALEGKSEAETRLITEGAVSILLAGLHLPANGEELAKVARTGAGLDAVMPGTGMTELFMQAGQILKQYLAEQERMQKALEQQFLPRLRAKQQEMEKRYGQAFPLDPAHDPEYQNALTKNHRMLEQKYGTVIDEIRGRVREIAGLDGEDAK